VLAPDIANAISGLKFSPKAYISRNFNPEATFKFWLYFEKTQELTEISLAVG